MIDIKPRHIRVLREIPISEMTDEEIAKAVMDRVKSKTVLIGYVDGSRWVFIWRYKNGFFSHIKSIKEYLENWFGCKMMKTSDEL